MQAISEEHKRTGCVNSHAKVRGAACNLSLAEEIGVGPFPRSMWHGPRQRREYLGRLEPFKHATPQQGQPSLSFGGSLRGLQSTERDCDGPLRCGVHFYGLYWTDASIYGHFFATSGPGGKPVRGGVYVEIGGQRGLDGSNTLFFEQHLDWTGIVIEPTACATCVLPRTRPRDRTVHAGACVTPSVIPGAALRHTRFCAGWDACVANAPGGYSNYDTPCEPMHKLLEPLPPRIDFFSIDVEEHVMAVLSTIPFDEIEIDVLLVEAKRGSATPPFDHEREARALLRAKGYEILHGTFTGDLAAVKSACVHD